jgi:hypothetical protein
MTLTITRSRGGTWRSEALAAELADMAGPCLGCENCRGLCAELIEAIVLPNVILRRQGEDA